ncbi:amidohydrolase family protein [Nocardia sp. 2]|uniref:Amidohydrolase family protein n=1 Tax=Nocardia acididurans TaxID=2802282 RepID=A0ABS1MED8_9NOCA|nr:amidohydrolase family protein [Nocardia acididurans]MBL1079021.1 amidohydrolase family protein [Nocardia acididurans]
MLPGLIDAHTHVFDGSLVRALRFGVTTEIDMFCLPTLLAAQRALAAERDDVADLRSAGTLATAPGGHPLQLFAAVAAAGVDIPDAPDSLETIDEPGAATAFVQRRVAEGSDFLKIVIDDGAVHGSDIPALGLDTVTALTTAAHAAGLPVIAHALTAREVQIALDAGVDGLAHAWADADAATSRQLAERVSAQGVFVVSTLAYFEAISDHGTHTADHTHPGSLENALDAVAMLHRAGATLLAGTDATPFVPAHGSGLHRELQLLTRAGLAPTAALAAATSRSARHAGLTDRGRIAPGLRADLLLVEGDPTRDITATQHIAGVWRRGVPVPDRVSLIDGREPQRT